MIPLQIFEKHPTADAYRVGGFYSPYALVSTDKRFSDAELAAECWRADSASYQNASWDRIQDTLYRFATLPHHDEMSEA